MAGTVLKLARRHQPIAITTDIMMPGMDGWSVITALKSDPAIAPHPGHFGDDHRQPGNGHGSGACSIFSPSPWNWQRLSLVLDRFASWKSNEAPSSSWRTTTPPANNSSARLRKDGWPVLTAVNGRVALEVIQSQQPALVFLDLMMPEMDGFEFLTHFRKEARFAQTPVIVLTAKESHGRRSAALEAGGSTN